MNKQPDSLEWLNTRADNEALERARAFILERAERIPMAAPDIFKIELALEEILINVVHYAYPPGQAPGPVDIGCHTDPGGITIVIRDQGVAFNPLERQTPDLNKDIADREIGGLGIFLTREMVDEITYERDGASNVTRFRVARA